MWPIETAGDEVRGQLINDVADHPIEIRDLNKKFEVAAAQELEGLCDRRIPRRDKQ